MRSPLAADLGIYIRNEKPGERRASCPECRKTKVRRSDDALAVKIDPDGGATWLCHRCGWKGGVGPAGERNGPADTPRRRVTPPEPPPDPDEIHPNRELAQEVWRQTEKITDDLPLRYLLDVRGIERWRWDDDRLRWHPRCPWKGGRAGCIVAPVMSRVTSYTVAIWRIKPVLKGKVERLGLGPTGGNAARLFPAYGPELAIAEGVEDALAAAELFGLPAWAALSAGNMAELMLPRRFREVLIVADRDQNRVGLEGANKLARRLRAEGRTAEVRLPRSHKDANDVVIARRAVA